MGIKGSAESDKVSEAPTVDSTKIFGQLVRFSKMKNEL